MAMSDPRCGADRERKRGEDIADRSAMDDVS
jgi:hypothetical protein